MMPMLNTAPSSSLTVVGQQFFIRCFILLSCCFGVGVGRYSHCKHCERVGVCVCVFVSESGCILSVICVPSLLLLCLFFFKFFYLTNWRQNVLEKKNINVNVYGCILFTFSTAHLCLSSN